VAALDLAAPGLYLSQSADSAGFANTLTLLRQHAPDVVITCGSSESSRLTQLAKTFGSTARFVALPRGSFDDTRGRSTVRVIAQPADKDALARAGKSLYLALAAADACVHSSRCSLMSALTRRSLLQGNPLLRRRPPTAGESHLVWLPLLWLIHCTRRCCQTPYPYSRSFQAGTST